jgi:FAD/FMN-containing dehydrogenase/Fe-S oxidoreductase
MDTRGGREIPWNYTSAEDKQIVEAVLNEAVWRDLQDLRSRRKTGRSARHVFRVVGDLFVLRRNAFVFHEFVLSRRHRSNFMKRALRDLASAESRVDGDECAARVLKAVSELLREVHAEAEFLRGFWRRGARKFANIVGRENCSFDPYDLVSHATDATDWRLHLPLLVVKPGSWHEVSRIVRLVRRLQLRMIPRGGGTGLTGGAVPLDARVVVLNTERLNKVLEVGEEELLQSDGTSRKAHVLSLQAGVTTEEAIQLARKRGFVFATDPTSSWACTIGGNLAENAGGKSAVAWGTAIDNVISFRMVTPQGELCEVRRRFHPLRKISPDDQVVFEVVTFAKDRERVEVLTLPGDSIRKRGLWKDVSNKWLGGVPGLQKEGVDGVIVDARFLLHREFSERATLCIEFFGDDMREAALCIRDLREQFAFSEQVSLVAMEHFDSEYCTAVNYRVKSPGKPLPKAVLLVDLGSDSAAALSDGVRSVLSIAGRYTALESHLAGSRDEATLYWADRKKLGAIAKRTNAFKLNEDIVLPIEKVADFVRFCDGWNRAERLERGIAVERQLIIATHMHAGDGNIHVNIPVFSNDREMLKRAHELADNVMALAKELGGAVSGEHGIGITKVKYLDDSEIERLNGYRRKVDPLGLFNPRKLADKAIMHEVFTPSFNLLKLEARILQHGRLSELSTLVAGCVRCGKCKPVCTVHLPESSMFYSPRDKILAIGALIEALLYDTQRRFVFRTRLMRGLRNISEHCTLCHKCAEVCPVGIDKGAVSLLERDILAAAGLKRPRLMVRGALGYLGSRSWLLNFLFRSTFLVPGMKTQRALRGVLAPVAQIPLARRTYLGQLVGSAPVAPGWRTFQGNLPGSKRDDTFVLHPRSGSVAGTVFYFPGCGSERLLSDIAAATCYLLLKNHFRIVLAPANLCCGFPHRANAMPTVSERLLLRNSMVFSRVREMISHWSLDAVVVSCGTCREALGQGEIESILGGKPLDIASFLARNGFRLEGGSMEGLYHAPCHDSLDGEGASVLRQVSGGTFARSERCCSEAGTLAISRPDIAQCLRAGKAIDLVEARGEHSMTGVSVLTNCPACVQGLSRQKFSGMKVQHIAVAWAAQLGGANWLEEFRQLAADAERINF